LPFDLANPQVPVNEARIANGMKPPMNLRSKRMVMCRVKDPGDGFLHNEIRDAERAKPLAEHARLAQAGTTADRLPRGIGILMARKFVDDLIFNEKGNEAFLIKYRAEQNESPRERA
jgi:hypothetical protein